jgi:hypothetical protein
MWRTLSSGPFSHVAYQLSSWRKEPLSQMNPGSLIEIWGQYKAVHNVDVVGYPQFCSLQMVEVTRDTKAVRAPNWYSKLSTNSIPEHELLKNDQIFPSHSFTSALTSLFRVWQNQTYRPCEVKWPIWINWCPTFTDKTLHNRYGCMNWYSDDDLCITIWGYHNCQHSHGPLLYRTKGLLFYSNVLCTVTLNTELSSRAAIQHRKSIYNHSRCLLSSTLD